MGSKKTILVFVDWFRPAYKAGGPITSLANLVMHLGDEYDFRIFCSDRDYVSEEALPGIEINQWNSWHKAKVFYAAPNYSSFQQIRKTITDIRPDIIYINGLFSRNYSIFPLLASQGLQLKRIIAPRGMLAPGAMKIKAFKKQTFIHLFRSLGFYQSTLFQATQKAELDQIHQHIGKVETQLVPNIPGAPEMQVSRKKDSGTFRLLSVGRIAPEKNIHFALECLKEVRVNIPIHYEIIGAVYDETYYRKCLSLAAELPETIEVKFTSSLSPDELSSRYRQSDLFFLPTLGENYGHAIIEALLSDTPVLISDQTPWEQIEALGLGYICGIESTVGFSTRITQLAEMSPDTYASKFQELASKTRSMLNLEAVIEGYKTLFG
jgi:glycosyltransferase involved in cell wall biosynthesis